MVKTVGKYDLYGTLGEGAFGKVKYAVNTETNEAVAIKILDKDKIQARNMGAQIKKEISIMKMINHHHVVSVKDVFATSAKIFIVLEFVGGGELFDKIANEGKLPEDKARFYFKQLVEGLEHCHNNGVCHRDLKPENLLLDTDGNLKISDFGFSTLNIGDADGDGNARAELLHTTCGTPNYVAPEVLGKDGYDGKKADVWSVGVILYVLLAGYLPFDENTMAALFQKIKAADYEFPDWFSSDARDLISKILVPDPHKRPRLAEIKLHPWMQKADSGPTPIKVIDHAAQMGVVLHAPTNPQAAQAVQKEKEQKEREAREREAAHHAEQQRVAAANNSHHHHHGHAAPAASSSGHHSHNTAAPTAKPAAASNDDKAAMMSSSTIATPAPAPAPVKAAAVMPPEPPKEAQKIPASPTPAAKPAPTNQTSPAKPAAAPSNATSKPAAQQSPAKPQTPQSTNRPPASNDGGGFLCCGGRRVVEQTRSQGPPTK